MVEKVLNSEMGFAASLIVVDWQSRSQLQDFALMLWVASLVVDQKCLVVEIAAYKNLEGMGCLKTLRGEEVWLNSAHKLHWDIDNDLVAENP